MSVRKALCVLGLVLPMVSTVGLGDDCPLPVGRSPEGYTRDVVADGTMAFMANGAALDAVDLSVPASPAVVGRLELPYSIQHLAYDDGRVYLLTSARLYIVDVADPSAPTVAGSMEIEGWSLAADGDLLCLGAGTFEILAIDVSDPSAPTVASSWSDVAIDLEVHGSTVYYTSVGLEIVDLSDPTAPVPVGNFPDPEAAAFDIVGTLAFLASDELKIVDLGDPQTPVQIGSLPSVVALDVEAYGDLAYVTSHDEIHVVDLSVPTSPQVLGSVSTVGHNPTATAAIADHVVVATGDHGIRVVDATDPSAPFELSAIDSPGLLSGGGHEDGRLFLAAERRGLRIVDVTDPGAPQEVTILDLGGAVTDVAVRDHVAVAVGSSLTVVDVSVPETPVVVGGIPGLDGGEAVEIADGFAYVANGEFGLEVVDLSTPSSPVEVGALDPGGPSWWTWSSVAVSSGHVFLGTGGNVEVIDVAVPTSPVSATSILDAGPALAIFGPWLLAGAGTDLRIFDIRVPSAPVEILSYPSTGWIQTLGVSGSVAYLGIQTPGEYQTHFEVFDIGDPRAPVLMGHHDDAGFPVGGFVFDRRMAYQLRYSSGFDVFSLCQGPIFADGFESGDTSAWSGGVP